MFGILDFLFLRGIKGHFAIFFICKDFPMLFIYLFLFILNEALPYQTLHFLEVGGLLALGRCISH